MKENLFTEVYRSRASKGTADLIGIRPDCVWAVQVKAAKPTIAEIGAILNASEKMPSVFWAMVWASATKVYEVSGFHGGRRIAIVPVGESTWRGARK